MKTRAHGRRRDHRYPCASHHHRSKAVCANAQEVARHALEDLVLEVIREEVLQSDLVRDAVTEAMRRLEEEGPSASDEAPIQARLHEVDIQLERLTEAVAAGGELRSLLARMQALESEREQLARSAARVQKQTETIPVRPAAARAGAPGTSRGLRGLLGRQVQITRQILGKLLTGRIELHPVENGARCEVPVPLTLGGLLTGSICPQRMACLTGIEPVSITRERPPTGEETDWQLGPRKLCPRLCPNGCLPSTNTVTYGETPGERPRGVKSVETTAENVIRYVSALFHRTAFQACLIDRSSISPFRINNLQSRTCRDQGDCDKSSNVPRSLTGFSSIAVPLLLQ